MKFTITVTGLMDQEFIEELESRDYVEVINYGTYRRVKFTGEEEEMEKLCDYLEESGLEITGTEIK